MNSVVARLGLTTLALVAGALPGHAQDATTGAIVGTVVDAGGTPVAGARIILNSSRGQQTYVTDSSGSFRAASLIPGKYTITVSAPGFEGGSPRSVDVGLNVRTPVSFRLAKTSSAVVEVIATTSKVDTTTQTSGSNFTSQRIQEIPLGRSFIATVNLAPGVVDGGGTGTANPSIGGSSGLENQYIIDGVNTTGVGFGSNGGYSRTYGSLGSGVNSDFIAEVQIKSFGLDAEYGGALGGIVNAITKSGDNTFSGTVFGYFDINALQSREKTIDLTFQRPRYDSRNRQEFGFTVSGPIVKDRLFYFVGYNPIRETTKSTAAGSAARPNRFAGRLSEQKRSTDSYYAKLNWVISADHSLEASIVGDPAKRDVGPQNNSDFYRDPIAFSELRYGGNSYSLKYNGTFGSEFFLEARVSDRRTTFERRINPATNAGWSYSDSATNVPLNPTGIGVYERKLEDSNRQFDIKLTKIFGALEFKIGYAREEIGYDSNNIWSGPTGFTDPHSGAVFSSGFSVERRYRVADPNQAYGPGNIANYYRIFRGNISPSAVETETDYQAYFIQGQYNWNNRLILKAGVRFDDQVLRGQDVDYKFKASDNVAPRLSVVLDPNADGKQKIYAFFGRYYEKVPSDISVRALSAEVGVSRSDFSTFDTVNFNSLSNPILDGTSIQDVNPVTGQPIGAPETNHYISQGGFLTRVLPDTKAQYLDEYVLGWDLQPFEGATISNRLIYRNLGRVLEDLGIDGGQNLPYFIGNPGENTDQLTAQALAIDPTLAGSGSTATWPKPVRKYYAYEFEFNKTSAKHSAFFNLRISRLEGNYEGLYRNDNGQQDPNISSLFDFSLEYLRASEASAARGLRGDEHFASGPLPTDRALVVNSGYSYKWTNAFSTGFLGRFQTGTPISAFYGIIDYNNRGELASGGRGAYGRTPNTVNIDATASYEINFRGAKKLAFRLDVFNIFNRHQVTTIDQNIEGSIGVANPDYQRVTAYQPSRQIRLGARFTF